MKFRKILVFLSMVGLTGPLLACQRTQDSAVEDVELQEQLAEDQDEEEEDFSTETADRLLDDKITIHLSGEIKVLDYTGDYSDFDQLLRSEQRLIYGLSFLSPLVRAYKDTGNTDYLDKGLAYSLDFINQSPFDPERMTWHDETTALRLNHMLSLYRTGEDYFPEEDKAILKDHMEFTAYKLQDEDFHSGNNNHGLYQDTASLNYAIYFDDPELMASATPSIEHYYFSHFDSQGVHLENSPEYHFNLVDALKNTLALYDSNIFENYDQLEALYRDSLDYSAQVLLPTDRVPNIGDSKDMIVDLADYYPEDLLNQRVREDRQVFLESGYDIYKAGENYLLFRAGKKTDMHHHNDDLSFWLYKDGNIFTEFGSFGYEYSHPHAAYQKSFHAHSSLVADGLAEGQGDDVYLMDTGREDQMAGYTDRIPGIRFERLIHFDPDLSHIELENTVRSKDGQTRNYVFLFHLDPAIRAEKAGDTVDLYRDGDKIGSLTSPFEIELAEDFYYNDYYVDPTPTQVIEVKATGTDIYVPITIQLK